MGYAMFFLHFCGVPRCVVPACCMQAHFSFGKARASLYLYRRLLELNVAAARTSTKTEQ